MQRQLEAKPKHLAQQSRELHLNNVSWKQSQNTWHSNDGNRTCATSAASKAKIPGTAITGTAPVQCHSAAKPKHLAQQSREPHLNNVSCKQSENTWHSNHGDRTCATSSGSSAITPNPPPVSPSTPPATATEESLLPMRSMGKPGRRLSMGGGPARVCVCLCVYVCVCVLQSVSIEAFEMYRIKPLLSQALKQLVACAYNFRSLTDNIHTHAHTHTHTHTHT